MFDRFSNISFNTPFSASDNVNGNRVRNSHDPKAVELKDKQFNLKIECVTIDNQRSVMASNVRIYFITIS